MRDNAMIAVDRDLTQRASELLERMGIPIEAAVEMFFKAVIRNESIPFQISTSDPFYSETNQRYLMESIRELDEGRGKIHELIDD